MDFGWSDDEAGLRTELRSYIEDHLVPGWSFFERDMPTPARIEDVITFCKGLAERGLLVPAVVLAALRFVPTKLLSDAGLVTEDVDV